MTASICGYCGYSRAVQVAGCDHATLPTAGEGCPHKDCPECHGIGWVSTVGSTCLACCGPAWVAVLPTAGEEAPSAFRAMEPATKQGVEESFEQVGQALEDAISQVSPHFIDKYDLHSAHPALDYVRVEFANTVLALAAEREKSALLAAELVDLQRQVVGRDEALVVLGTELEQERRECGRLRADLESARQLLDGEGQS